MLNNLTLQGLNKLTNFTKEEEEEEKKEEEED